MKPIIGITCPWSEETWGATTAGGGYDYVGRAYVSAIYRAGGLPILISSVPQTEDAEKDANSILELVDGLYFTGGGNCRRPSSAALATLFDQQPARSAWESLLIKKAYENDVPTIGACRGHQMMTVVLGGEMDTVRMPEHKQDIPTDQGVHDINIAKGSLLEDIIGSQKWHVNSIHVERVKKVPTGFIVAAQTEDGTIEAFSATGKAFFLGTQFHPELMHEDERSQKIFTAFIQAANRYHNKKI